MRFWRQWYKGWSSRWCALVRWGHGWGAVRGIEQHNGEEQGSDEDRGGAEGVIVGDGHAGSQAAIGEQGQRESDYGAGSPPGMPCLGVGELRG